MNMLVFFVSLRITPKILRKAK